MIQQLKSVLGPYFSQTDKVQIVPTAGITAHLTTFTAGAMAFLAVFAMALLLATNRVADQWATELAQSSTIRISASPDQMDANVAQTLQILDQTEGVLSARALDAEEQRALLEPWFGANLPVEDLSLPQLIEILENGDDLDTEGLRLRLEAEVPGAILDDHTSWRGPLIAAAGQLRTLGWVSLGLILLSLSAMVTLAANTSLAANAQVIRVLRLVGAEDSYVAQAFVRRFVVRTGIGAVVGTVIAMIAIAALPNPQSTQTFLTSLGFDGSEWLWPILIPIIAALVAFFATRISALRKLQEVT
jgi:cell division transport system permease protein